MPTRPVLAGDRDAATLTRLLTDAFHADGVWGQWAFPDPGTRRANRETMFRQFVDGALRYPFTWLTEGETAASVWIPPGGTDVSDEQERKLETFLRCGQGVDVERVQQAFGLFDSARPSEPHYYLSLLGTDPGHAGRGHGQRLLAHNLGQIDTSDVAPCLPRHIRQAGAALPAARVRGRHFIRPPRRSTRQRHVARASMNGRGQSTGFRTHLTPTSKAGRGTRLRGHGGRRAV